MAGETGKCVAWSAGAAVLLALLLAASWCPAQPQAEPPPPVGPVRISFPLEGHYRVGRYMPVRVAAAAARPGASITLAADGAVPTELEPGGGKADTVVPWM